MIIDVRTSGTPLAQFVFLLKFSMKPKLPPGGCQHDATRESCPLACKYNLFQSEDLEISAWELKCDDCGWRDTVGYRSDEVDDEDVEDVEDPQQCPFCQMKNCPPGINRCEASGS